MKKTPTTACETAKAMNLPPLAMLSLGPNADHMMQLIAFHDLYAVPMSPLGNADPTFAHMDDERVALRLELITEEFKELFRDGFGIAADVTFSATPVFGEDRIVDALADARRLTVPRNGTEVADALGDIVYLCYGMALEMGYDLRDVLREIHAANLTKLAEDGTPIYREDGKVLKGPNYHAPNIPAALGFATKE